MAGAVIGKGGHNIQKLRTEVCVDKISIPKLFSYIFLLLIFVSNKNFPNVLSHRPPEKSSPT